MDKQLHTGTGPEQLAWEVHPFPGETVCGDAARAFLTHEDKAILLAVADGLGHGPMAAQAAGLALETIDTVRDCALPAIFNACDEALRNTRGVALGLIRVWPTQQRFEQVCVGNIRAVWAHHSVCNTHVHERRLGASRGIVGGGFAALRPESFTLHPMDCLFLYTDGFPETAPLTAFFEQADGPLSLQVHEALTRYASGTDDAGLLVYRHE